MYGKKGVMFKVDFEKAYDSVSWAFLSFIMEKMGFSAVWRKWILECLNTTSVSVLVNGNPKEEFSMGQGLRQGDPLSPSLFLLVAEGLRVMLKKTVEIGKLKG